MKLVDYLSITFYIYIYIYRFRLDNPFSKSFQPNDTLLQLRHSMPFRPNFFTQKYNTTDYEKYVTKFDIFLCYDDKCVGLCVDL